MKTSKRYFLILAPCLLAMSIALAAIASTPSPGTPGEGGGEGSGTRMKDEGVRMNEGQGKQFALLQPAPAADVRFETVDIYVDTAGKPLGAYQFTFHAAAKNTLLTGLEGGEHAAFSQPPYYDPNALIEEKVIVAAFSTADALPQNKTRIARLHVQVTGDKNPEYVVQLQTAAAADGSVIDGKISLETKAN